MGKIGIRYLVFWLFLLGIIVIVFLQVISGNNITRLIDGNRKLLDEIHFQNAVQRLEADVLTLESDVRGAVITQNPGQVTEIEPRINRIQAQLASLKKSYPDNGSIKSLDILIQEKLSFSRDIINTFKTKGKSGAESLITTNRGRALRDSIELVITQLDQGRQSDLQNIFGAIQKTGRRAQLWGFIFAGFALLAVIISFLYIINKGRQQTRMIESLNESEKRNKEAALMKEQFMANMSHEIRTPMNSILGFTSLLRRTSLTGEQQEYVQNIHSSGENLLALVNDILDLSKIEAGMMHLEETRFSLRSLVSSVGAMFNEKLKEKGLVFEVQIDKNIPDILSADAVRLTQILVNLLSNAVKFTEEGKVVLKADALDITEETARLRISVIDTGIGIAPDKQQRIFERFQQAEAETTRRFGGTGLGLAIVKQLVDLQNGLIDVKSEPGKGSEFIVTLTFKLPDLEQLYSTALAAQSDVVPLERIRVLIAEDHHMNQQLISHLMKSWGIDFRMANNGQEAIELVRSEDFSLILMDIQMPEMDGYTATNVIRTELNMDIPIIAMTAHAMSGEKEKCLQLGMNDYVSKPLKETTLYNMIARYAQNAGQQNEVKAPFINLEYLHQLSGNDPQFERAILEQFLVQTPEELEELHLAVRREDHSLARRIAHSLKSTVGYVGLAEELHPYLDRMEKGSDENGEDMSVLYNHIRQQCEVAMEQVKLMLEDS
jgi:signal transduction histidine kinase/DNA-binding response OmpR family regulator